MNEKKPRKKIKLGYYFLTWGVINLMLLVIYCEMSTMDGMFVIAAPIYLTEHAEAKIISLAENENLIEYAIETKRTASITLIGNDTTITLHECTGDIAGFIGYEMVRGGDLIKSARNLVILDERTALSLSPSTDIVGQIAHIDGVEYMISGIYRKRTSPLKRVSQVDAPGAIVLLKSQENMRMCSIWGRTHKNYEIFSVQTLSAGIENIMDHNDFEDSSWDIKTDVIGHRSRMIRFMIDLIWLFQMLMLDIFIIRKYWNGSAYRVLRNNLRDDYFIKAFGKAIPFMIRDIFVLAGLCFIHGLLIGKIEPAINLPARIDGNSSYFLQLNTQIPPNTVYHRMIDYVLRALPILAMLDIFVAGFTIRRLVT